MSAMIEMVRIEPRFEEKNRYTQIDSVIDPETDDSADLPP